jgi:protocatechuate 3,4-dioxygenase beta subunit
MTRSISRRDVLRTCTALGALTAAAPSPARAAGRLAQAAAGNVVRPTPASVLGPFYKRSSPKTSVLRLEGDPGLPLTVRGRVTDIRGGALAGTTIEVWHADHAGHYDITGYRFRATLTAGAEGDYAFESVMPGHYPDRVAQHVHYLVSAPGHRPLVTQLYFATDQAFEGDPVTNFRRDPLIPGMDVVRPVVLAGAPGSVRAAVVFDLCLERL